MKPRILQLVDSFDQGGSERQALELTRLLHDSGKHEVYLASLKPDGVLRAQIADLSLGDVPCYPLTSFHDRNATAQLRSFVRYLKANKIDLLHTHDFYTNIFGMTAGFLAGVNVRIAARRETNGMRSGAQQQAERLAYSLAHQLIANSESVKQKLLEEGVNGKKITVIHNGLNLERVRAPMNASREEILKILGIQRADDISEHVPKYLVTIVANMRHEVKDYPLFLRAAERVSRAMPDVGFLLAGEGELQESLQRMAVEFGIGGNAFFLGRCENIAQLLKVSNVCVLSSKAEGFSNSILEYMAAGRPVVATDVGGAREAIVEGETGYTVPSGDDQLMAERIVSLLRDPEKARLMGEQGRRVVEQKFSSQALLQNTEALYEKLLAKSGRTGSVSVSQPAGACPPSQLESCWELRSDVGLESRSSKNIASNSNNLRVRKAGMPPLGSLRVLVVAPSFDILGGQAVQAARLVSRLRDLPSFEVGVLPINPRLPSVLRKLQSIKYLRTVVTSLLYIATLLTRVPKFDVIHVFSASYFSFVLAPTPAILIAKLFGKKVVLNYHSGEAEDHLTRWRRSAFRTIRLADEVAVPSSYLARVFAQFGIQTRAINNLIELDKFNFRERSPLRPVFLSNRNLETHYGVDQVLRAFALIQKQVPDAELTVAGDGSQRAKLETLAHELRLQRTKFVGRVEHERVVEQYQAADIYLNGSEIDNQPLSILEAFACGLPVVTTDAGGIPDMVRNGETGFVVTRGDHEALANRALELLAEPDVAASIARKAREECEQYSWERVRDEWVEFYYQVADRNSPPSPSGKTAVGKRVNRQIGKLRKMTVAEFQVRSSQAVAAFAERIGWSALNKLPSDRGLLKLLDADNCDGSKFESAKDLLEHFRTRSKSGKPVFFAAFADREAVIAELRGRWPDAEARIITEADAVLAGRFDLLGFKGLSFGTPIDWQLEPVSGKSAPKLHWSRLDYLNADVTGDKKIVWELNRHQYFLKLGQAYWLTKDEKYAAVFVAHLNSWMDQNPPKIGINWASSLEISFRSISWLWALHYFQNSQSLDSKTFTRALKFLCLNGRHLETYLSTYFSPNTHLTGEALGLFYLGTLLPEFQDAARWRAKGQEILLAQLARQVKPDGVYFEQSSYYHRYTTDFYTHLLILARLSEPSASASGQPRLLELPALAAGLQSLLDHLMYITRPDGTSPLFGDDDGGRLVDLDRRRPANDFRAALCTGATLFARADYKFVAGGFTEETLWLLGVQGAKAFDQLVAEEPAQRSKDFPDGGYYVMRDGWNEKANYLLFNCGPHGTSNGGHAHADALAIEVAVNGRPMLVDPGTYTYTGSKELRDLFRGSAAHNVLLVDGEPSSVPAGPFSWETTASCKPLSWISERRFDYVEGRHDGYERLQSPATHTRSILFLKNDYWLMRDLLTSTGNHSLDLRFHFAAGANSKFEPGNEPGEPAICNAKAGLGGGLQLTAFAPEAGPQGLWSREEGSVSDCYGERAAAAVCTFSANSSANESVSAEVITLLLPNPGPGSSKFEVKEVEAIGGRAFEIKSYDHCDLVMLRDAHSPRTETVRLISDFNWTWARFPNSSDETRAELLELLVLDGQRLQLDGSEILKSAKRIDYLMAAREGDRFRVETSEGLLDLSFPIGDLAQLLAESNRQAAIGN